jgi:hypothetical protein
MPLILGFAIVLVAVIATLGDLTYLRNAHLALKSEGQEVLAQSMRHLSTEDYYNGRSASGTSTSGTSTYGKSVPIDCHKTYLNILTALKETRFYISNQPITISGFTCINSWIEFEISTSVLLPFNPRFLVDVDPTVTSLIRGGSRYFSD